MSDQSSTENSAEVNDLAENGHAPEAELPLLAARTLSGDLRDAMLDLIRDQRTPWHKLPESQQAYVAERVQDRCAELVGQAVNLIAARDFPALAATLKEAKIKDGIEAKLILSRYDPNRHELMDASGSEVLLLLADAKQFSGARGPAKIDKQALFDAPPVDGEDGAAVGPLFDAAAATEAVGDPYARQTGYEDGYGGHQDHAARYPSGEPGHGDYWLGHAEGERERDVTETEAAEASAIEEVRAEEEAPPARRRGRPRKEAAEARS